MTDTMPAFQSAIFMKAGLDMSKWVRGGLHQPPALESLDQLGGQRFVAVTAVALKAAVQVPYPVLKRFPYPQAPPETKSKDKD